MTNREVYQKIFGFPPDRGNCPADNCKVCPLNLCDTNGPATVLKWWDSEYKGNCEIKIEVIEYHTFAKPNDVSSIDFPGTDTE